MLPGLLSEYLPADADAQKVIASNIQGRKVHVDAADTTHKKKIKTKPKVKRITSRQKRQLGLFNIPAHCHKYDLFLPLHQLWLGYIDELFANNLNALVQSQKLIKADYHGAILTGKKPRSRFESCVCKILTETFNSNKKQMPELHRCDRHLDTRNREYAQYNHQRKQIEASVIANV